MKKTDPFGGITACGESCTGCAKRAQGLCSGCRETDGRCQEWADTGRCPIHACASRHGVLFCGLCESFPCGQLPALLPWNPAAPAHLAALAAAYRAQNGSGTQPDV
jgi:hypothetical protein